MDLEALGNIGDFVGGIGVIVTLVYLAVQIRSNTRAMRASTHQQWSSSTSNVNLMLTQDGEFARIYRTGTQSPEELDPAELTRFNSYMLQTINGFESLFFQRMLGVIDEAFWRSKLLTLQVLLSTPGARSWWDRYAERFFDERFRDHIKQHVIDSLTV